MSLLDRLEVPEAKSRCSTTATLSPRVTASNAHPMPVMPPPTTNTSTCSVDSRLRAFVCARDLTGHLVGHSGPEASDRLSRVQVTAFVDRTI